MKMIEWVEKWKDIRCHHFESCLQKGGFDFEICDCGLEELWKRRSDDLNSVPAKEYNSYHGV